MTDESATPVQITNNEIGLALQQQGLAIQALLSQLPGPTAAPTTGTGALPPIPTVPDRDLVMPPTYPKAEPQGTIVKANANAFKFVQGFEYDSATRSIINILHQIKLKLLLPENSSHIVAPISSRRSKLWPALNADKHLRRPQL